MNIVTGTLTGLFSYDVGYEIALDEFVRAVAPLATMPPPAEAPPVGIRGAGRTMDVRFGARRVHLPTGEAEAAVVVRAHDFGVLTAMLRLPLAGPLEDLGPLTAALVRTKDMEKAATELMRQLLPAANKAISKPSFTEFLED